MQDLEAIKKRNSSLDSLEEILSYLQRQADGRSPENEEAGCLLKAADRLIFDLIGIEPGPYDTLRQFLSHNRSKS